MSSCAPPYVTEALPPFCKSLVDAARRRRCKLSTPELETTPGFKIRRLKTITVLSTFNLITVLSTFMNLNPPCLSELAPVHYN